MEQKQRGGLRRFLQTRVGRTLLIAFAIAVVFGTFVYVTPLLAIPAFLVVGLAAPIYAGIKRPRYLALSGLVVILIVAPLSSVAYTMEIMTPTPFVNSNSTLPDGNGGAVLQGGHVSPFNGDTSTNFTWTVSIYPQYRPPGGSTFTSLHLYISTCPGATANTSATCPGGYPFHDLNNSSIPPNPTHVVNVTFHFQIGTNGIWSWQMALLDRNNTTHNITTILLVGDPTYNGVEGPIVGDFATFFSELLPTLYLDCFLFLGGPFYCVLLLYMVFKNRERRRRDMIRRIVGPIPPTAPPATGTATAPGPPEAPALAPAASPPQVSDELPCPNCSALVYPGEPRCWKCGADLSQGGKQPLRSNG
ncbi:MAG TPA: hypothetical protein VK455_03720 [Thermoplasmata archaeon]|nr:hypothetical protein [Thermoplasmata archaeon]